MKARAAILLSTSLLVACAPPPRAGGPSPEHGFETFGIGLGNLVVAPFMIVAGLLEGISTLPYLVGADLHEMNRSMVDSQARVDLDRTYRYAYEKPLAEVPASGDTGRVFRHMRDATAHFRKVLTGYGVIEANEYVLTAVRSADREGYTLYSVVHRPVPVIRVRDPVSGQALTLDESDDRFWRPWDRDVNGRPLDLVIDWAGVPRTSIRTQKGQAILMTLAANSVLINRRVDDYWAAERRWEAGDFLAIVADRKAYLDRRMGLAG